MDTKKGIKIAIQKVREYAILPVYAHENDAGMDIYAAEDMILKPGETKAVPSGFSLAIPDGYEIQLRPRSGLSLKTMLRLPNSPGTIDAGYRDEVCVIIHNASFLLPLEEEILTVSEKNNRHGIYKIQRGDRIAQMVFAKIEKAKWVTVSSVKEIGEDREGGFGSTGIH